MRKNKVRNRNGEDLEGLTWSLVWVWALAAALSIMLTTGCGGSPTGPDDGRRIYPPGYYWLNTTGAYCGSELEVKPFEELWSGPGECAWCEGQALWCAKEIEVKPWFDGGKRLGGEEGRD